MWSPRGHAATFPENSTQWCIDGYCGGSPHAACVARTPGGYASCGEVFYGYGGSPVTPNYTCNYMPAGGGTCPATYRNFAGPGGTNSCPSGSTGPVNGACTPNAGMTCTPDSNNVYSCVSACASASPQTLTWFVGYDNNGDGLCDTNCTSYSNGWGATFQSGGCAYQAAPGTGSISCYAYTAAPTKLYCQATFNPTGQAAGGSERTGDTPSSSSPCGTGFSYGTVNGIGGCYASGSQTTPPAPTTDTTTQTWRNAR